MANFEVANPFRVLIETKNQELELLEKAKEIKTGKIITEEERAKKKADTDQSRRKYVFEYFEIFAGRPMTEEEYLRYVEIYENPRTRKGFNIKNFADGDDGHEFAPDGST